jgi:hypothetical protein
LTENLLDLAHDSPAAGRNSQLKEKQDSSHNLGSIDMSSFKSSSGFRSFVSASAAVVITGLIVWSFYGYAGYLERNAPSTATSMAQIESGSSMSDRDTRNG